MHRHDDVYAIWAEALYKQSRELKPFRWTCMLVFFFFILLLSGCHQTLELKICRYSIESGLSFHFFSVFIFSWFSFIHSVRLVHWNFQWSSVEKPAQIRCRQLKCFILALLSNDFFNVNFLDIFFPYFPYFFAYSVVSCKCILLSLVSIVMPTITGNNYGICDYRFFFLRIFGNMKKKNIWRNTTENIWQRHIQTITTASHTEWCMYVCVSVTVLCVSVSLKHKIHIVVSIFCSYSSPYNKPNRMHTCSSKSVVHIHISKYTLLGVFTAFERIMNLARALAIF